MNRTGYLMRERRCPVNGRLDYVCGDSDAGKAQWQDVSRCGARVRMGRYILPGRMLRLRFTSGRGAGSVEINARVAWCRQMPGTLDFVAGLALWRDEPEDALAFAALREQATPVNGFENERVRQPRWVAFEAAGESEHRMTGRTALRHAV